MSINQFEAKISDLVDNISDLLVKPINDMTVGDCVKQSFRTLSNNNEEKKKELELLGKIKWTHIESEFKIIRCIFEKNKEILTEILIPDRFIQIENNTYKLKEIVTYPPEKIELDLHETELYLTNTNNDREIVEKSLRNLILTGFNYYDEEQWITFNQGRMIIINSKDKLKKRFIEIFSCIKPGYIKVLVIKHINYRKQIHTHYVLAGRDSDSNNIFILDPKWRIIFYNKDIIDKPWLGKEFVDNYEFKGAINEAIPWNKDYFFENDNSLVIDTLNNEDESDLEGLDENNTCTAGSMTREANMANIRNLLEKEPPQNTSFTKTVIYEKEIYNLVYKTEEDKSRLKDCSHEILPENMATSHRYYLCTAN